MVAGAGHARASPDQVGHRATEPACTSEPKKRPSRRSQASGGVGRGNAPATGRGTNAHQRVLVTMRVLLEQEYAVSHVVLERRDSSHLTARTPAPMSTRALRRLLPLLTVMRRRIYTGTKSLLPRPDGTSFLSTAALDAAGSRQSARPQATTRNNHGSTKGEHIVSGLTGRGERRRRRLHTHASDSGTTARSSSELSGLHNHNGTRYYRPCDPVLRRPTHPGSLGT